MAQRRVLVKGCEAVYHLISRTSFRIFAFGDQEKEVFLSLMRKQAIFCGVEVLCYCILDNHFHLLVRVPPGERPGDAEMLRRYRALYAGERRSLRAADPDDLESLLLGGGVEADLWRRRLWARMGSVSVFMRELKQRFSIWYNRHHQNTGTLWSARFKSLVVEPDADAMACVAAYIDLNPVRAGLVADPAAYRFGSHAAAFRGGVAEIAAYAWIYGGRADDEAASDCFDAHRAWVSVRCGVSGLEENQATSSITVVGRDALPGLFRRSVRYFSDGMALGSKQFLAMFYEAQRGHFPEKRRFRFVRMKGADWGGLRVIRDLQVRVFGTEGGGEMEA
jgi:REP element-mobilizing transposase RayT